MATLLSMIQTVTGELGLPVPSSVATSSDPTSQQLMALLNREGRVLVDDTDWPILTTSNVVTLVNGQQDYAYPADFKRMINQTGWDRTNKWALLGPDTPQIDMWRRESNISQAGPRRVFMNVGTGISIWPTPTSSGQTLIYDYIKKNWARTASGTAIDQMTADTDVPILDENLLVLGTIWRFLSVKGLDATMAKRDYDIALSQAKTREIGGRRLDQAPLDQEKLIGFNNIPDAGYGN